MPSLKQSISPDLLRTLHRIHRQLTDLQGRLDRSPRVLAVQEAAVKSLQAKLDQVEARKQELNREAKAKQQELDLSEQKVGKREKQLQEAKNNTEYQALKDQIAADEMANSVMADEALEMMDKADDFDATVIKAKAERDEAQSKYDGLKQKFDQELPGVQTEVTRLTADLQQYEAMIPAELGELYKRHVREQGEDAMAPVDGLFCGGCSQKIPVNMINSLMLEKMTICNSCGRMLYLPEGYDPKS